MRKVSFLVVVWLVVVGGQGFSFASPATDKEISNLQNCLGDCIMDCRTQKCIGKCGETCLKYAFGEAVNNLDRCEDLLVPVVSYAVEKAAEKGGCWGITAAFDAACSAATAMEGALVCLIGGKVVGANCGFHGNEYATKNARNIARDVCDYVFPDANPYILIENRLKKGEHSVDFKAVIGSGGDVHMRGDNWLEAGHTGILASHKLKGPDFHNTVEARIQRSMKKDITKVIHDVKPNHHLVYVYYKDGKYHLGKKKKLISPVVGIGNDLKNHSVDFRVVVVGSNDVHLPGNNWLKAGGEAILGSYKLFGEDYQVKARVKRAGKEDIHLTEYHVQPGVHRVYVYNKDGKYHIAKKEM